MICSKAIRPVVAGGRVVEDGDPADLRSGTLSYGDLHRAWVDSLI